MLCDRGGLGRSDIRSKEACYIISVRKRKPESYSAYAKSCSVRIRLLFLFSCLLFAGLAIVSFLAGLPFGGCLSALFALLDLVILIAGIRASHTGDGKEHSG